MADRSTFSFIWQLFQGTPSSTVYQAGVEQSRTINATLLPGGGDNQADVLYAHDATLSASGTLAIDLQTSLDRYGVALTLTSLAFLAIENVEDGAGGVLEVRPNVTNGFTNFLGASSALLIKKGSLCVPIWSPLDNRVVVSGSNKAFDIVETGGANSAHLRVWIMGRR